MFEALDIFDSLFIFVGMIAAAISGWIITGQVQQRMKKTLGRKATDLELASLRTWMEVENEEKLREAVKLTGPK